MRRLDRSDGIASSTLGAFAASGAGRMNKGGRFRSLGLWGILRRALQDCCSRSDGEGANGPSFIDFTCAVDLAKSCAMSFVLEAPC